MFLWHNLNYLGTERTLGELWRYCGGFISWISYGKAIYKE